jgi:Tol biopolymer transport system component
VADVAVQLRDALSDRYTIERELGRGGMAMVYLARDLKHERLVALKVLRAELSAILGGERFLREIRLTAALQHPHILPLLDSGEAGGFLYYVLPFVRGESLRDRLNREKQLGLDEALTFIKQVASALDYAHHQGVVHRDIKPENILIQEGEAMLADFGIALAVKEAGGNRLTETGLSLGTPQYMSPEQATGDRQLDARSDVYSLGAVLYELLAGEPPVTGPNAQAMIAKLITERPTRLRVARDTVPEGVDAAVAKALSKVPADRFPSAGEFASALQAGVAGARPPARWPARELWIGVGAAAVVGLLAFGAWRLTRGGSPVLVMGRSEQLTSDPGLEIQPAISPDGRLVAYSAGNSSRMRTFIRPAGGGRTIPLSDDSTAVETQARWSPDGSSLLFLTRGGVSVAPALGGSSRPVVAPASAYGVTAAAWSPDGQEIAFVRGDSLQVVPLAGGPARWLTNGSDLHSCSWSPNGRWIACVSLNQISVRPGSTFGNLAPSTIILVPAAGGKLVRLLEPRAFNQSPVWSPVGRLFFLSNRDGPRDIYVMTLSSSGRPRGEPARLTTGLGAISISLSRDGRRLAYATYSARANIWSLPIPSRVPASAEAATPVTNGSQVVEAMRVSRDGRWLVFDSDLRGNANIYRVPVSGGQPEQLTSDPADEFAPDLSPDGRAITYHSWRTGTRDIETKPLDGGPVVRVTDTPAQESFPVWSPDGRAILFYNQVTPFAIYVTRRGSDGRWSSPPSLLVSPGLGADWSPDGAWVAYAASESDVSAGPVMVVPAAGGVPRRLFEPGPAAPEAGQVLWSPDGRKVYYKAHDAEGRTSFWAVSATGGAPRLLVRFPNPDRQSSRKDFAVDGRRLYFAIEDRQSDVFVAEMIPR